MRIDHKNGTVHFGKLQLESDRLRDNIAVLARRLAKAITIIDPLPSADKEEAKKKVLTCPLLTCMCLRYIHQQKPTGRHGRAQRVI